ncbi:hypothetical protein [Desertihabitans aurantiacus]|nr:hypothetical protein [Desertihabitans aurantiacus]
MSSRPDPSALSLSEGGEPWRFDRLSALWSGHRVRTCTAEAG